MEVLFVTHKYPPAVGGMEQQSYHLIHGISASVKVHVLKPKYGSIRMFFYLFLIIKVNLKLLLNSNIKIIHSNDAIIGILCSFIIRRSRVRLITTVHGLDVTFPSTLYQNYFINRLKKNDFIIAVSHATAKECLVRGIQPEKVSVILNGVDHKIKDSLFDFEFVDSLFERFDIDLDTHILVSTGRAVKRKGFSWFVKNVLPKIDVKVLYLVIGPIDMNQSLYFKLRKFIFSSFGINLDLMLGYPSDSNELNKMSGNTFGLSRFVHLGKLEYNQMMSCISISDAYIMPNIHVNGDFEGFGLVSLEANMRSKFVIASDMQGIKDAIFNGVNGIRLDSENEGDWIQYINHYLTNVDQIKAGNRALAYAQSTFNWDSMVMDYYEVFSRQYDILLKNQSHMKKSTNYSLNHQLVK